MSVSTTELIPRRQCEVRKIFTHENCVVISQYRRMIPMVVDDQKLRTLRDKHGHTNGSCFSVCPECTKTWAYEQMVKELLKSKVPSILSFPDRSTRRLESMAVKYQKP
jgi:hypothetical protein